MPNGRPVLTDSGLETVLIFLDGIELPEFASFTAQRHDEGRAAIERYYRTHLDLAARIGAGFLLEAPTWRTNPDWGARLGVDTTELAALNRDAVDLVAALGDAYAGRVAPIVLSAMVGPRADAYDPHDLMTADEAYDYHRWQTAVLARTRVRMLTALTLTYVDEAIGITRAAHSAGLPVAISFTTETDGRLPDGTTLGDAIKAVDAATAATPIYYMVNCAHPTHFEAALAEGGGWLARLGGIRANASTRSHHELDEATDLDSGDPSDLGRRYRALLGTLPHLSVLGGCCGTDVRHIEAIAHECLAAP